MTVLRLIPSRQAKYAAQLNIAQIIPSKDPEFLDLISKCLDFDKTRRLTARQVMRHPFILKYGGHLVE